MTIRYSEIKNAFDFVSAGNPGDNVAYVSTADGEIYYYSSVLGLDETRGLDIHSAGYITVPHRQSVDMESEMAYDFVDEHLPEHYAGVRDMFADEINAEGNFRNILEARGLLVEWHAYREKKIEEYLREWCRSKNIGLES